nr:hypothetical protein [Verminephrobacter eiseniae]
MVSNDPDFETKAADVIGLYLNPPVHAVVFCVDEKTAIQALDRQDRMLPLSPGRAESHGFEYKRNGTLSLFAALNMKDLGRKLMRYIREHNKNPKPILRGTGNVLPPVSPSERCRAASMTSSSSKVFSLCALMNSVSSASSI